MVCTFVPRPFESDPGALKVPFFHSNDDYDEVLFYHRGDFFSRDDVAVMLDTRDALEIGTLPEGVENPDYVNSWRDPPRAEAAE